MNILCSEEWYWMYHLNKKVHILADTANVTNSHDMIYYSFWMKWGIYYRESFLFTWKTYQMSFGNKRNKYKLKLNVNLCFHFPSNCLNMYIYGFIFIYRFLSFFPHEFSLSRKLSPRTFSSMENTLNTSLQMLLLVLWLIRRAKN